MNIHEPGPFEGRLAQWPVLATAGALEVRLAETESEVEQAQRLRYHVFYEEMAAVPSPAMRERAAISTNTTRSATTCWSSTVRYWTTTVSPWSSAPTG
ncbi:MAG: hypothetical protein WDM81_00095 [Rhizomicrobium sp.]